MSRIVDFHAHPVTDEFRKAMEFLGIDPIEDDGFPLPKWSIEEHLAFMSQAEIDFTVLSPPTPHIHNSDDAKSRVAARRINEELSQICRANSGKFAFTAVLPLPDVDGAIEETAYAMVQLGAVGVKLSSNSNGVYLGDDRFEPLMKELNCRKAIAIIHPCRARLRPDNVITGKVAAIYEYPADTTRAVLNMIANQVMTRYPDIQFVVPHNGSFLPYMASRLSGVSGILASLGMMDHVDVTAELSKLYFDIASDPEPVQLDMLRMIADDSHIVYGSDFPHSPAKVIINKKKHLDGNEKYNGIREIIYAENAKLLLER